MTVQQEGLRGFKAHRFFVKRMKKLFQEYALEKFGRKIPAAAVSPNAIDGVQLVSIPVPPMLEEALGYRGALRFVEFRYSRTPRQFVYSDGGDNIPSDEDLWIRFLRHPLIAPHLPESRYPTLYGAFREGDVMPPLGVLWERPKDFEVPHCLLLDREKRELYLCLTDHTRLLFALMEPENEDHHSVYIDGMLMSPGTQNYKIPPRKELAAELTSFLDGWLDASLNKASE